MQEEKKKQKVPYANRKLRNVEAVKQMLDGTHHTQTKKVYGWNGSVKEKIRKVGEVWIDEQGKRCEQKEGYITRESQNAEVFNQLRNELYDEKTCPKCGKLMTKRLDKKYFLWHQKCMDCVIEFETRLRIQGKFEEYEKQRIKNNIDSFLNDATKEKEFIKDALCKDYEIVLENGDIEKWTGAKIAPELVESEFIKFKERLYKRYNLVSEEVNDGKADN